MQNFLKTIMILIAIIGINTSLRADENQLDLNNDKGYRNITEIGFSSWTNMDANPQNMITVSNVNAYQFNSYLSLGLGIGYEHNFTTYQYYGYENGGIKSINTMHAPIFADFRVSIDQGQITPFLFLNPGYHFILNSEETYHNYNRWSPYAEPFYYKATINFDGGMYINAGLGLKFKSEGTKYYLISLGYKYEEQTITSETNMSGSNVSEESKFFKSFFTVKLGYSF